MPTTSPTTSSATPIVRLFPLPKYAVKIPARIRNNPNTRSRIVRNCQPSIATADPTRSNIAYLSELDASQRLRVDDARDRADLVDDQLAERVEVLGLDLRDQVVLPEQRMELDDPLYAEQFCVDLVLLRRGRADEDEPDGQARNTLSLERDNGLP